MTKIKANQITRFAIACTLATGRRRSRRSAKLIGTPKEITIVLPHSLGGGQDRLTRALVKVWSKKLGPS